MDAELSVKKCCMCREIKPASAFSSTLRRCKPCNVAYTKAWKAAHPDKNSAHARKHKYGLDHNTALRIFNAQGRKCLICEVDIDFNKASLDHDHTTRAIRGFLCRGCNLAIGQFKDSPLLMWRAIEYLERHGEGFVFDAEQSLESTGQDNGASDSLLAA